MKRSNLIVSALVIGVAMSSIGYALESSGERSFLEERLIRIRGVEAEIIENMGYIKIAELTYESNFDVFVTAAAYPPVPSDSPQEWVRESSGGFATLGWSPDGDVRGSYSVTTTTTNFTALGIGDIDGDGTLETYRATKSINARAPENYRSSRRSSSSKKRKTFSFDLKGLFGGPSDEQQFELEILQNVQAIKTAEFAYEGNWDVFVPAALYPKSPSSSPQEWVRESSGGFATLGWSPDGDVRGSYSVTTTATNFTVIGIGDVDGDGTLNTYQATKTVVPHKSW